MRPASGQSSKSGATTPDGEGRGAVGPHPQRCAEDAGLKVEVLGEPAVERLEESGHQAQRLEGEDRRARRGSGVGGTEPPEVVLEDSADGLLRGGQCSRGRNARRVGRRITLGGEGAACATVTGVSVAAAASAPAARPMLTLRETADISPPWMGL